MRSFNLKGHHVTERAYAVTITIDGTTHTAALRLPVVLVNNARQDTSGDVRKRLADRIYYAWRGTADGRRHDTGIPLTYTQLSITEIVVAAPEAQQLDLFDH